ncbi:hypothetical protein [Clostridium estertheticum]|uniref:hypothetical protein n=1 Tax=Clostridium estertheticum TaxID=238834 RepID=UPI001CF3492C|nr:hypothetical protein [Clostridium estertheticum]MCB2354730.1 hypothetical protein [Clostridium estertheticum]WAG40972.1 hypothetical protein LL065_22460 [Clostridium estertheticum]
MIEINYLKEEERIAITKFLQWEDKNGCYTDENSDMEEVQRMSYKDAVKYFFGVINYEYYDTIADNIFELTYEEVVKHSKEQGFYNDTIEKLNSVVNDDKVTTEFYRSLI